MEKNVASNEKLAELHRKLEKANLGPLWEDILHMVTKEPYHEVVPYLWKWETIRNHLIEAGKLLGLGRAAERRVIYLQNPSLLKKGLIGYATHTLYAGIQLLMPGEVAPAHRHSQTAIRFIIEGDGAYTAVNGEKTYMDRGDLILTPAWTWHDHGHSGDKPMIWMDGLDVGLVRTLASSFFEAYPDDTYPDTNTDNSSVGMYSSGAFRPIADRKRTGYPSPLLAYKWTKADEALTALAQYEPDPHDGYAVDYINPITGGSADARIGTTMQKLTPGMHTKAHRHVHSAVYHVRDGNGYTVINGQKFEWSKGDFFILPPWNWHEHVNTGSEDVHLFSISDAPVLEMLGLDKVEAYTENGGFQSVTSTFVPDSEFSG